MLMPVFTTVDTMDTHTAMDLAMDILTKDKDTDTLESDLLMPNLKPRLTLMLSTAMVMAMDTHDTMVAIMVVTVVTTAMATMDKKLRLLECF